MSEPQIRTGSNWAFGTPIDVISFPAGTQAQVSANTTVARNFTIAGLKAGTHYPLAVFKPTEQAGLAIASQRVSADNTLTITYENNTAAAITPTAGETYAVAVVRAPLATKNTQYGSGIVS